MAYMQVLADGRVFPQTDLPEWMWRANLPIPQKEETATRGGCAGQGRSLHQKGKMFLLKNKLKQVKT
jgi:hypothetical protein